MHVTTVVTQLASLLASVTPADIAALDAEIARLTALRAVLAGKAPAPIIQNARAPGRITRGSKTHQRRLKVAALLVKGPARFSEIVRTTGIPASNSGAVLRCPWFQKTGPINSSPYAITDAGRAALAATPPEAVQ
jgi:hypothetical protein